MLHKGNMLVKDIYFNQIKQKKGNQLDCAS